MRFSASGLWQRVAGISGKNFRVVALTAPLLLGAAPAFAILDDRVEIWAAENITHDTNVLRLSKHLRPESMGASQLSDTIYTTHLGINANLPVSQQLFTAEYQRFRSDYHYFK